MKHKTMTEATGQSYNATRILREMDILSLEEKILVIGAVYIASRKKSSDTLGTLADHSINDNSPQRVKDTINEIRCLNPKEMRHLVRKLTTLYFQE